MILHIRNLYLKYFNYKYLNDFYNNNFNYIIGTFSVLLLYNYYKFNQECINKCISHQIVNKIPHPYMTGACYETNVYGIMFNQQYFSEILNIKNFMKYMIGIKFK